MAVLGVFIATMVSAVVIMAAFAAGVAVLGLTFGLAFGALGALAIGIVTLAERTNQGQVAFGQLTSALGNMATTLGAQALPMAQQMAQWAIGFIPVIQQLGAHILDWFGPRLPALLALATTAANLLTVEFQKLGPVIGAFLDRVLQMAPSLLPMFQTMLTLGVPAVQGLLTNLLALSEWFLVRMPTMGPIVMQIMGGIGTAIQALGPIAAAVVSWFVANWPGISSAAKATWDAIAQGIAVVAPMFDQLTSKTGVFAAVTSLAKAEGLDFRGALMVLTVALGTLVAGVVAVIAIIYACTLAFGAMSMAVRALYTSAVSDFNQMGATFSNLGSTVSAVVNSVGSQFSWLGGQVNALMSAMAAAFGAGRAVVYSLEAAVAGAMGGIIGAINNAVGAAQRLAGALGAIPGLAAVASGAAAAASAAVAAIPQIPTGILGSLGVGHAAGGPVSAGQLGWVGERGPELFVPNTSGTIIPNNQARGMTGQTINVYVTTNADPNEIARAIAWRAKFA
ncbi:MAG: hypothetical protein M3024_14340 [Candidatus Dormibacteraeota bacterium]|nr:hypothetical protein [Candidatus Dormibacteraeota bacterium]